MCRSGSGPSTGLPFDSNVHETGISDGEILEIRRTLAIFSWLRQWSVSEYEH